MEHLRFFLIERYYIMANTVKEYLDKLEVEREELKPKIIDVTISLLNREEPFERDFSYGNGYSSELILDVIENNK